jgi:hypothetical protein
VDPGGGRPARFYVGLARGFMDTCLHEKGNAKAVEKASGGLSTWLAGHVAWLAYHHLASYRLGQVVGAPPRPYKYPFTDGNQNTQHILEIPLVKLSLLV